MDEIKADPAVGLEAAIAAVPELASSRATQAAILAATIESWTGPVQAATSARGDRSGRVDGSITFMAGLDLVKDPVTTDDLVRRRPAAGGGVSAVSGPIDCALPATARAAQESANRV